MILLAVKQNDSTIKEFRFAKGPVYIGRHAKSQIFISDIAVSRHHAVIFSTPDGKWMAEDLDSTNKTYLNGEAIHKAEVKTDDILRISDVTIQIKFEEKIDSDEPDRMEDTLIASPCRQEIVVRKPYSKHAPDIRLPAERTADFIEATGAICKANGLDEVIQALLHIAAKQFSAFHAWCALRDQPCGPMTRHAGKKRSGEAVVLTDIMLNEKITQAVEDGQFILFPRISTQIGEERIHSAVIVPVMDKAGCFGVIYIDNAMDHEHYTLGDLDYLMLIAIHTAAILENF